MEEIGIIADAVSAGNVVFTEDSLKKRATVSIKPTYSGTTKSPLGAKRKQGARTVNYKACSLLEQNELHSRDM